MTETEIEVINLIRNHSNPGQALNIGLELLIDFLDECEKPQYTSSVPPRATA